MMNKTKKEYVATFVCQKLAVSVRTDAEEIVDCVCERLQHHFNAKEYSDSILVTAFSVQHRKKEVFSRSGFCCLSPSFALWRIFCLPRFMPRAAVCPFSSAPTP